MSPTTPSTPMKQIHDIIKDHEYWRLLAQQKQALMLTMSLVTQGLRGTNADGDIIAAVTRVGRVISSDNEVKDILVKALQLADLYDKVVKMAVDAMCSDIDNAIADNSPLKGLNTQQASALFADEVRQMVAVSNEIADIAVDLYSDIKP